MTESEFIVAARAAELTASRDPLPASLARLPEDLQAALTAIGAAGRGLFGNRNTQSIFDANLPALERLYGCGASTAMSPRFSMLSASPARTESR